MSCFPEKKKNRKKSEKMGGLFSKEKKTKQHESKVTEQDKAILVRCINLLNYYDTLL